MSNYNSFEELYLDVINGTVRAPNYFIPSLDTDIPKPKHSLTSIRNEFIGENENLNPHLKYRLDLVVNIFMTTIMEHSFLYNDSNYTFSNRYEYIINVYDRLDYVIDNELLVKLLNIIHDEDLYVLDMLLCIVENKHTEEMFMKIVPKVLNNTLKYIHNENILCNLTFVMKCMKYYNKKG